MFFSDGIIKYFDDLLQIGQDHSGIQLINAGRIIDKNTYPGDKIISLGNAYIYPFTQRNIASRFFIQGSGLDPILNAREEFLSDIMINKPSIIAIFISEDGRNSHISDYYHGPILELIEREYNLLSDENGFLLFIRNNRQ